MTAGKQNFYAGRFKILQGIKKGRWLRSSSADGSVAMTKVVVVEGSGQKQTLSKDVNHCPVPFLKGK